jgi:hypothetical protein
MSYRTIGLSKWDSLQKCRKSTYLLFAIVSGLRSREWESASQTCQDGLDSTNQVGPLYIEEPNTSPQLGVRERGNEFRQRERSRNTSETRVFNTYWPLPYFEKFLYHAMRDEV